MTAESKLLSQTLQSITATKKHEQDRRRNAFEDSKSKVFEAIAHNPNDRARVEVLLSAYTTLTIGNKATFVVDQDRKDSVQNIHRYLEQTRYDPSVSSEIIQGFEHKLSKKFVQESHRFAFASLYYRLVGEWNDGEGKPMEPPEEVERGLSGSYEHVQKYTLEKLQDKFSDVVFTPLLTDEAKIDTYMNSLFEDDYAQGLLDGIRRANADFAQTLKNNTAPFKRHMLLQCIRALLSNTLLNEDAKTTLTEFSTNEVVLCEIVDVLNLRFADLDNWSWQADEGMYYEPRRQPNGKYRIMMDMDILQAIFLHYIAVSWCAHLKSVFRHLPKDDRFWRVADGMSAEEKARHEFFIGAYRTTTDSVCVAERDTFLDTFLLSALPASLSDGGDPYGDDNENADDENRTGLGMRQRFLRQLATDVLIRHSLHGEVAVVQSDLQWYATGLPHSTLLAVLRFWGIPEDFIAFFKKYAEAPLRMSPTPGDNVRTRQRGVPITDAFETLFGEMVLFCMDVAVNRLSGMTLIRFHDDLYLHGEPTQTTSAWETIESFVKVFGLDINTSKTGSVYISDVKDPDLAARLPAGPVGMGMLQLSDAGEWKIDQDQVAAHTRQLHKQLGQCTSIMSWIQTWNACMGRFFQDTFGRPANCFGQAHVLVILETHAHMQRQLFDSYGGSIATYLRAQLHKRFDTEDVPDAFFFLPEEFGGLGVKNPFIPFLLVKSLILENPLNCLAEFRAGEEDAYKRASYTFAKLSDTEKQRRFRTAFGEASKHTSVLDEPFFSFDEFTSRPEMYSHHLVLAHAKLMCKPLPLRVCLPSEAGPLFRELQLSHGQDWYHLTSEVQWVMQLYAEELKETFGALSIVDKNLLPGGVMKILKARKVTWQQIIWA
jgi:hypothetical protein